MSAVRKALLLTPVVTCLVIGSLVMPTAAFAATTVSDVAPPPPRIENVPHRDGYVWAAGHWEWNGKSWTWNTGSYVLEQRHAQWIPTAGRPRVPSGAMSRDIGSAEERPRHAPSGRVSGPDGA